MSRTNRKREYIIKIPGRKEKKKHKRKLVWKTLGRSLAVELVGHSE